MKVQISIPDGEFADAAKSEADIQQRTVANLALYALRILLTKHQYKLPKSTRVEPNVKEHVIRAVRQSQASANGSVRNMEELYG